MTSFSKSVKINCEKKLEEINKKTYAIASELFRNIVYDTPILDGYLINSWFTGTGNSYSSALGTPDTTGSGSLLNIQSLLQGNVFLGKDGAVNMVNNQLYAYRIEYLGWSSIKAPQGMVRINITSVAAKNKK